MKRILFLHEHNSSLQPSTGRNYNRRSRFQTLEEVFRMLYKADSAAYVKRKMLYPRFGYSIFGIVRMQGGGYMLPLCTTVETSVT